MLILISKKYTLVLIAARTVARRSNQIDPKSNFATLPSQTGQDISDEMKLLPRSQARLWKVKLLLLILQMSHYLNKWDSNLNCPKLRGKLGAQ